MLLRALALALLFAPTGSAATFYVDASASPGGSGTSWADAFRELGPALDLAQSGDEVWVAEGTYRPSSSDRSVSFRFADGVAVYGGFPSGGAAFDARDPDLYATVLSGDLAGNDGPDFAGYAENSEHVVDLSPDSGESVTSATVLDGVTIRGGNADNGSTSEGGGGLRCVSNGSGQPCAPTVRDVRFVANRGNRGGGAYFVSTGSNATDAIVPVVEGGLFEGNEAFGSTAFEGARGGGVYVERTEPVFRDVTFRANRAIDGGGAAVTWRPSFTGAVRFEGGLFEGNVAAGGTQPVGSRGGAVLVGDGDLAAVAVFEDVRFASNRADAGGALAAFAGGASGNWDASADLLRCTFEGNTADDGGAIALEADDSFDAVVRAVATGFFGNTAARGGAVYAYATDNGEARFTGDDVLFSGNAATTSGGAVFAADDGEGAGSATLAHATLNANAGPGALASTPDGGFFLSPGTVVFQNTATWDSGSEPVVGPGVTFASATVEGGCPAGAACSDVLDADPLFADPDGADGVIGTADDDLRTTGASPAVDAGDGDLVPPDRLDYDDDGDTDEPLPFDFAGLPRVVDGAPDLGAYERADAVFVEVELTTDRPVVGPQGGALTFDLRIQNTSSEPLATELWAEAVFADGSTALVLGPDPLTLAPGETFGPSAQAVSIPAASPVGDATLRVRIGDFPDAVLSSGAFAFEVSATGQLTVQVTTTEDQYGGLFGSDDDGCGLREAIETVNTGQPFGECELVGAGSPARIEVPAGLYLLTRDTFGGTDNRDRDLSVEAPVRIVGAGIQSTFISAAALDDDVVDRVVSIVGDGAMEVELSDLAISGGTTFSGDASGGGGIRSVGAALTLTRVEVSGNEGGDGGGVLHDGAALRVVDSVIRDNVSRGAATIFDDAQARDGSRGGGIAATGTGPVEIVGTVFEGNVSGTGGAVGDDDGSAGDGGLGGGLFVGVTGAVTIDGSTFTGNAAGDGGSASDGFTGEGGSGGGLAVRGGESLAITATEVSGNAAGAGGVAAKSDVDSFGGDGGNGGGLWLDGVEATLTELSVTGNAAGRGGDGFDEGAGDGGFGGGLAIFGASDVTLERSLLAGNTSGEGGSVDQGNETAGDGGDGGGLYVGAGAVVVRASTLSGNALGAQGTGSSNGSAREGRGGGAVNRATLSFENATVTDNDARAGGTAGGVLTSGGATTFANSIVAGNAVGGDAAAPTADCDGPATDAGFNVVGAGTGCPDATASTVAVAPASVFVQVIEPELADNGGPTLTHALVEGASNPAVDIGGACGPVDQRGLPAPVGACDAGAVEAGEGAAPAFVVTLPLPGAYVEWGDIVDVQWTAADGTPDGPLQASLLCVGEPPLPLQRVRLGGGTGRFRMPPTVGVQGGPADMAGGCRVEIALADDPAVAGTSALFVVQDPGLGVAVTQPDGQADYAAGGIVPVRWEAGDVGDARVRLSLVCDGRDEFVAFPDTENDGRQRVPLPPDFGAFDVCLAQVAARDDLATYGRSAAFTVTSAQAVDATTEAPPAELTLEPPYPNPMRAGATVRIGTPEAGPLAATLYDVRGRRIAVLADGDAPAGWRDARLDAARLAPGVYVVRVASGGEVRVATVTVVR